ncbi:MAG: EAL domain-containing protein [Ruminococcaceae bacterium]|nr:EAL domain-containing protein [Oscillospiraceae bacterium]
MEISFKFQILAIGVLMVILVDYLFSKRLPLISTKTFTLFWAASFFNLLFDILSVYTLNNMDTVPEWVNRLVHQFFIGSLDATVFLLFIYVCFISGAQKRLPKILVFAFSLPFLISVVFAMFAPLYYEINDFGAYSYGPMVNVFYISIAIYIVSIFVILFKKNNAYIGESKISDILPDFKRARVSIVVGLCIWIAVALIQFITRYWLISGMGVSLMAMYVYMRFENPREYSDSETGTYNRRAFHIMVPEMYARKKPFYMVSFTIDNIEQIQKSMGYDMTKSVLKQAAKQIAFAIPGVRLYHSRSHTLTAFIEERQQLDNLASGSELWNFKCTASTEDGIFFPTYHLTIMECPKYAANTEEAYDTLDYCLSQPSLRGEGKIYYITDEIIEQKNYRMAVLGVLTKAVKERAFNVVFQPIYSAAKKRYASAEALVRLQDTTTVGFISPEYFIPLAEEQGLIGQIGNIVFEKVCDFAAREKLWQLGIDYIEVNLSGVQSVDISLVATLTGIMRKYGVHPGFFNLEITETASIDGGDMLAHNMEQLRRMGCHFSMDDFGTGYSNLAQMAKVHFELIKLDKSLIWPCFGEDQDTEEPRIILDSCIDMILRLGVNIVAEGVETAEQAELLISKGVEYLQGYHFCRPVGEAEFVSAVKEMLAKAHA